MRPAEAVGDGRCRVRPDDRPAHDVLGRQRPEPDLARAARIASFPMRHPLPKRPLVIRVEPVGWEIEPGNTASVP